MPATTVRSTLSEVAEIYHTPILELIASGELALIVNTPSPSSGPVRDAAVIRHAAIHEGVLCVTSIETALAVADALDPAIRARVEDVRPLDAWLAGDEVVEAAERPREIAVA